jgi:hypothetical protein
LLITPSIVDTPEIGDAIIDELLVDALLYLNRYKDGQAYSHDVMRSMNLVIDQLQPQMLWDFMCQLFANDAVVRVAAIHRAATSGAATLRGARKTTTSAPPPSSSSSSSSLVVDSTSESAGNVSAVCAALPLVDSLLDILPSEALHDSATQSLHLPTLLCAVVAALHTLVGEPLHLASLSAALQLALKIVGKLYSLRHVAEPQTDLTASSNEVTMDDDNDDNDNDNDKVENGKEKSARLTTDERALKTAASYRRRQRETLKIAVERFHDYVLALFQQHSTLLTPDISTNNKNNQQQQQQQQQRSTIADDVTVPSPLLLRAFDMTCQLLSNFCQFIMFHWRFLKNMTCVRV